MLAMLLSAHLLHHIIAVTGQSETTVISDALHLTNLRRYLTNPFLASKDEGVFACYRKDPGAPARMLKFTEFEIVNMREVLPQLSNQTILFWGDSLVVNQFVSFASLLWEADDSCIDLSGKGVYAVRCKRHNIDAYHSFSWTLMDIDPQQLGSFDEGQRSLDPQFLRFLNGTIGLRKGYRKPTAVLASTGHHWMANRYHLKGADTVDLNLYMRALTEVHRLLSGEIMNKNVRILWRAVPPRHFENGDWNSRGVCGRKEPLSPTALVDGVSYLSSKNIKLANDLSNIIRELALKSKHDYIDILPTTLHRADALISDLHTRLRSGNVTDCVHYCIPGVPDTWNTMLVQALCVNKQ